MKKLQILVWRNQTGFQILHKIRQRATSVSVSRGESRCSHLCVQVYRLNSAHNGATTPHHVHGATRTVRKTMEMDISNTPQVVNRTSKYMKITEGRNANYTLAPYCYQGIMATSSSYCFCFLQQEGIPGDCCQK